MKRAFRLTAYGISGIMAAQSRGQAKFRLFRTLQELGYKPSPSNIRCRREGKYDSWAELDSTGACWNEAMINKD